MTVSDALNAAADHIATFGHYKGTALSPSRDYTTAAACVVGAISLVSIRPIPACDALKGYLGRGVVSWNDAPERTAAEVIEALRAAALIEAAKETAAERQAVSA